MDRRIYICLAAYSILLTVLYAIPSGLENEWYSFYAYLDCHGATPYLDVREGYPPLGFLIYMPIFHAFGFSRAAFSYGFRVINGLFLVATVASLYMILKQVFKGGKAMMLAFCYAGLPSVIVANIYSNDIVALLPASLAIYMMLRGRSLECGVLIGLATLGKGFPLLLIIPALRTFRGGRDRVKLLVSLGGTLALASLPFIMLNPLTYISTYTHHGSRGPWETVWALLEGYYSHGGLLHPYFDKFFYHSNLLVFYPPTPSDHAFYEWRLDFLPTFLTLGQAAIILALALSSHDDKRRIISLCGLVYVGYMLFFKGYSTQFSVSTQHYVLLAALERPLVFLPLLEVSHILQMISWMGFPLVPLELLRDHHRVLLIFSIILRTIIFTLLILKALRQNLELTNLKRSLRGIISGLTLLRDRRIVISALLAFLFATLAFLQVYMYARGGEMVTIKRGRIELGLVDWSNVALDGFKRGDQVIIRLETGTWVEAEVYSSSGFRLVERGLRNPYNLKGSFNETLLFYIASGETEHLMLRLRHPKIPFRVTDGLDGDTQASISSNGSAVVLRVRDLGRDGAGSLFRLAYPIKAVVDEKFKLLLRYRSLGGSSYRVLLDVFDETDEWLYTFEAGETFLLDWESKDLSGYSNLDGDELSMVAFVLDLEDGGSAEIVIEELKISGEAIKIFLEERELVSYDILAERDFKPSILYLGCLTLSMIFISITIYLLWRENFISYI